MTCKLDVIAKALMHERHPNVEVRQPTSLMWQVFDPTLKYALVADRVLGDGNLDRMKHDSATRARIARGWAASCPTQAEYAAQFGISTRMLRTWVARYVAGSRPEARVRAIVEKAIKDLQELLAGLAAEKERLVGAGEWNLAAEAPERSAASASSSRPWAPDPAFRRATDGPRNVRSCGRFQADEWS